MMPIRKGQEPPSLAAYRRLGTSWDDLPTDVKRDVKRACFIEQSGLCAFCCIALPNEHALQRIAHVVPRSKDPGKALDFNNMVLSCSSGRYRLEAGNLLRNELSCDEHQGSKDIPIHPLMQNCMGKFAYLENGAIVAAMDIEFATESISVLNLDCSRLRRGRSAAIDAAREMRSRMPTELWESIYMNSVAPHLREFMPAIISAQYF